MSLLLDALRKSANQRHLGSPPGLEEGLRQNAPVAPARRSWLAPLLVVIIIALIIAWQPWRQDTANDQDVVENEQVSSGEGTVSVVANETRPREPVARDRGNLREEPVDAEPDYDYESFPDLDEYQYESDDAAYIAEQLYRSQVDPLEEDPNTEVDGEVAKAILKDVLENSEESEEYREFISQIAAEERGEIEEHPDTEELGVSFSPTPEDPLSDQAAQLPGSKYVPEVDPEDEAAPAAQPEISNPGTVNGAGRQGQQVKRVAENNKSEEDSGDEEADGIGVVSYYELPVNVRTALPPLDVQIRVYDADPAKRFVVTSKNRVHEGEAIAEGVTLHQIRRDGLVLVFRSYVFLWNQR